MSGTPEITLPSSRKGFTLIELLVVVAIIALLVSILLPSLEGARRSAQVVVCSNNIRQYALGLCLYATSDPGNQFPPHCNAGYGTFFKVWSSVGSTYTEVFPDKQTSLEMFRDVICGGVFDILWCPLNQFMVAPGAAATPINPITDPDWPLLYYDNKFGENYLGGYVRFANCVGLDYTDSGNDRTDGPPVQFGSANDAIVADFVESEVNLYLNVHGLDWYWTTGQDRLRMAREAEHNVGFGDGHVETRYQDGAYFEASGFINWPGARWVLRDGHARAMY